MKNKVIFLIIKHKQEDIRLKNFYKLWCNIINYNIHKLKYDYDFIFIEYDNIIDDFEMKIINNIKNLKIKGYEKIIPNLFFKTIEGFKYINNNYEYKYIIRTNLSSIWNLNVLQSYIYKIEKFENYSGGIKYYLDENNIGRKTIKSDKEFLHGTCIFISKNIVNYILNNYKKYNKEIYTLDDDVVLGLIINQFNIENNNKFIDIQDKVNFMENISSVKKSYNFTSDDLDLYLFSRIKIRKYKHRDIEVSNLIFNKIYI